ncbi:MAG: DUF1501 domain-containing protein [Planctomycetota bacterium]
MLSRRELLERSTLLALAPATSAFRPRAADGRVLVVLQLDGGNDGLNTVVPYADELYHRFRPKLALAADKVLKLSDTLGLHPGLAGFARLLERDRLAIVQGVGYPEPNRSHDVSQLIWQTARFEREEHKGHGWLGRAFDGAGALPRGVPAFVLAGNEQAPHALFARRAVCATMNTLDEYAAADFGPLDGPTEGDSNEEFVRRTAREAESTVARLQALTRRDGGAKYPASELARRLELVAQLLKAGLETPVYYVLQRGYDTHFLQLDAHAELLTRLGNALEAFQSDLEASGLGERVLVLVTSEFGRRVEENASMGTDHGAAAPVFLLGRGVRPGLHGVHPRLEDLDAGDLKWTVDFRAVYASVLEGWLGIDSEATLGGRFAPLDLLKA